jgi:apolipoprotein N-acyltransferase
MLVSFVIGWQSAGLAVPENRRSLALIQPNYEPHYSKFSVSEGEQLRTFMKLSAEVALADLYVFPETSFGNYPESRLSSTAMVKAWVDFGKSSEQSPNLLAGISSYREYNSPNDLPALRSQQAGGGRMVYYTAHNSAVPIIDGQPGEVYHKSRLVPGVEFFPYRKALFFFEPLVESLGGTTAGLGVSDSAMVFAYPNGIKAAPLICYESIYGDYVREFVLNGANLLVVPTNDGWWDDSPGHVQHLQLAQLRAIETRRWVAQAANSGISGIINPLGELVEASGYDERTALYGEVGLREGDTFYVRWGDQLGRLAAGFSVIILIALLAASWRRRVS